MTDRFDKFTERARKTLQLAQVEAQRFGHNYIGTEHILLGLVKEGGIGATTLLNIGADPAKIVSAVEFIISRSQVKMGEIGLTPRARRVIELAVDEARRLKHHYIGTEHILLGLMREGEGIASGVLESMGVTLQKIREEVISKVGVANKPLEDAAETDEAQDSSAKENFVPSNQFSHFTERARRTVQFAQEEAKQFGHSAIAPEHIFLGLVREGDGVAARVLQNLGVQAEKVRSGIASILGRDTRWVFGEVGMTETGKQVLVYAVEESQALGHHYIGTEHLLLGLMRLQDGVIAGLLGGMGISTETVREQVVSVLKSSSGYSSSRVARRTNPDADASTGASDRYDLFTDGARKTLQFAQEESQRFNHNYIGTEHILLGLVKERGVGVAVLASLKVDSAKIRSAVEFIIGRGDRMVMGEIGLTPGAKKALELAVDEARRRLNHKYIGKEHILLGLVREGEGIAAGVLESLGLTLEKLRAEVAKLAGTADRPATESTDDDIAKLREAILSNPNVLGEDEPPVSDSRDRFDKFSESARKTLQFAQEEAQRFKHNYIGTEHILLGLMGQEESVAARVLNSLGIELARVRTAVEFIIGRGDRMVMGEIGLTPRAKRVIELAVDEARRLKHDYIGTEHLLLGLVREGEGIAAGVLESLGVSLERVRATVLNVLKGSSGPSEFDARKARMASMRALRDSMLENLESEKRKVTVSIEMLKTMFDYSIWARDQLLPLIKGVEERQLKEAPADLAKGLYGSMHDTLAHMAQSEWLWVQRCLGESPLRLPKGEDFADLGAILEWWNTVHSDAVQLLNVITEEELQQEITYLAPDGKRRTRKIWHMLVQVPNHQTEHRSQLATMLGSMGLEVPPTDMVVYLSQL